MFQDDSKKKKNKQWCLLHICMRCIYNSNFVVRFFFVLLVVSIKNIKILYSHSNMRPAYQEFFIFYVITVLY